MLSQPKGEAQGKGCADQNHEVGCKKGHHKGEGVVDFVSRNEQVDAENEKKDGDKKEADVFDEWQHHNGRYPGVSGPVRFCQQNMPGPVMSRLVWLNIE